MNIKQHYQQKAQKTSKSSRGQCVATNNQFNGNRNVLADVSNIIKLNRKLMKNEKKSF